MNKLNKQISVLIIIAMVQICVGCASSGSKYVRRIPDYEKASNFADFGAYYVARNIKAHTEDSIPKFGFELLKIQDQEGTHYYVTKHRYPSSCGNFQFMPDNIKFIVNGKLITLKQELVYVAKNYDVSNNKNVFYKSSIEELKDLGFDPIEKFCFEISEDQIREIAYSENVLVFYRMTEGIEHGRLFQKNIERFQIFLMKYVDKW